MVDIILFDDVPNGIGIRYVDVDTPDIVSFDIITNGMDVEEMHLIDFENEIYEVGKLIEQKGYFNRRKFFKDTFLSLMIAFKDTDRYVMMHNLIEVSDGYMTLIRPTNLRAVYNTYANIENFKGEYIESIDETNYIDVDSSNQCG